MGHWGWRPLVFCLFISVWIVGCTTTHETAFTITPTEYPPITLVVRVPATITPAMVQKPHTTPTLYPSVTPQPSPTPLIYVVRPGDTLLGIARNFGVNLDSLRTVNGNIQLHTLQIGQQLLIPDPQNNLDGMPIRRTATPPPLPLPVPTCYETRTDKLVCLGQVTNHLNQPLTHVAVSVFLFDGQGQFMARQETLVEQQSIPPSLSAPYRVVFNNIKELKIGGVSASLLRADITPQAVERFIEVAARDEQGEVKKGQYILSATLYNPGQQPASIQRVIAMLTDQGGQVRGYRVLQVNQVLATGETLPIRLPVMIHTAGGPLSHTLYVEAQPLAVP